MHTGLVMLQDAADSGSSTRLIFVVLGALWLLAVGALLIHIARANGARRRSVLIDLTSSDGHALLAPQPAQAAGKPPATIDPIDDRPALRAAPQPGVAILTTSVVPAASAMSPRWDPTRNAWVSEHPDFGVLVLNTETNRWRAS